MRRLLILASLLALMPEHLRAAHVTPEMARPADILAAAPTGGPPHRLPCPPAPGTPLFVVFALAAPERGPRPRMSLARLLCQDAGHRDATGDTGTVASSFGGRVTVADARLRGSAADGDATLGTRPRAEDPPERIGVRASVLRPHHGARPASAERTFLLRPPGPGVDLRWHPTALSRALEGGPPYRAPLILPRRTATPAPVGDGPGRVVAPIPADRDGPRGRLASWVATRGPIGPARQGWHPDLGPPSPGAGQNALHPGAGEAPDVGGAAMQVTPVPLPGSVWMLLASCALLWRMRGRASATLGRAQGRRVAPPCVTGLTCGRRRSPS